MLGDMVVDDEASFIKMLNRLNTTHLSDSSGCVVEITGFGQLGTDRRILVLSGGLTRNNLVVVVDMHVLKMEQRVCTSISNQTQPVCCFRLHTDKSPRLRSDSKKIKAIYSSGLLEGSTQTYMTLLFEYILTGNVPVKK